MKLCADCNDVQITNNRTYCKPCAKKRKLARTSAKNAERSKSRKCQCGCGKLAGAGSKYHPECSVRIGKEKKAANNRNRTKELNIPAEIKAVQYEPTPVVKTAEQTHIECRKEERRLEQVRAGLNMELLAARNLRGAVVGMLY